MENTEPSRQPGVSGENPASFQPAKPSQSTPPATPVVMPAGPAAPSGPVQKQPKQQKGGIFSFFVTIFIAFLLVQLINAFLFQSYRVVGHSMFPTLDEGDLLVISKIGKTAAGVAQEPYQPNRGDIVVFQSPKSDLQLVKRVIALPGERVVVRDGTLTVFNEEFPNGFLPDKDTDYADVIQTTSGNVNIVVPEGHLFVSGDNREGSNSLDSRNELGTVPADLVVGKLALRIWPLGNANFF